METGTKVIYSGDSGLELALVTKDRGNEVVDLDLQGTAVAQAGAPLRIFQKDFVKKGTKYGQWRPYDPELLPVDQRGGLIEPREVTEAAPLVAGELPAGSTVTEVSDDGPEPAAELKAGRRRKG